MLQSSRIITLVVGCGNMGQAFIEGQIKAGVPKENFRVLAYHSNEEYCKTHGLQRVEPDAIGEVHRVIITVKPGIVQEACKKMIIVGNPVFISLAALVTIAELIKITGSTNVGRIMTTLACENGHGVGCWKSGEEMNKKNRKSVQTLADQLGSHIEAQDEEKDFREATVLSCMFGAAFVLLDALTEGMADIGASKECQDLVLDIVKSACDYKRAHSEQSFVELAESVTTPKGGTRKFRDVLEERKVPEAAKDGVKAANGHFKKK